MSLICMWMKSHFHMKGWAPRLALKKRLKVIRKWPICYHSVYHWLIYNKWKILHPSPGCSFVWIFRVQHFPVKHSSLHNKNGFNTSQTAWQRFAFLCHVIIYNGNWTSWSAIWSEIILVISKSNERVARVRFEITSMISDQNCTPRSSIGTLLDPFWNRAMFGEKQ